MTERVVFCREYFYDILSGKPRVELGRMKDGLWAAVSDETLLSAGYRNPIPPLLYFSKDDYDSAIRKLQPPEVAQVIQKRLEHWSPRALDETLNFLYLEERRCLALAAMAGTLPDRRTAEVLDEHVENTLQLLASVVGEGRYDDMKLPSMLIFTLESEARAVQESLYAQEAAQRAGNVRVAERMNRATAAARKRAETLGSTLRALGRAEYGSALPYVEMERVMFIQPSDAQFLTGLRSKNLPVFEWKDGVVAPWPVRRLADMQDLGKTAQTVYLESGEFLEDILELTPAQVERGVAERVEGELAMSGRSVEDHLNKLLLELNLLRRNAVRVAHREGSGLVGLLQKQVQEETATLTALLASHPSWLAPPPKAPEESLSMLKEVEARAADDAAFFEELCRRGRKAALRSRFAAIVKIKKRDVARVAGLRGPAPRPA